MLGFNHLLRDAGLDPKNVKLARHQDNRPIRRRCGPYVLWGAKDGRFEHYQRIQHKDRFKGASHLASFVVTPAGDTLFVGIYQIDGVGIAPAGTIDLDTHEDDSGHVQYDMHKVDLLAEYDSRLIIDWGNNFIAWVQIASNQDKPIIEIRRQYAEPPFPGLIAFHCDIGMIEAVPESWRTTLKAVKGVYLLVCMSCGKPYVGSARGGDCFWGRWLEYAQTGHGGNEGMKLHPHSEYQVTILEVAPSSATDNDIMVLESRWKDKLLSRKFGLNEN